MLIGKDDGTAGGNCFARCQLSARYLPCNGLRYIISLEVDMLI